MSAPPAQTPPTALELRDGMVEDYARRARELGGDVPIGDIERIVADDLRVYEAVEREKKTAPAPKPAEPDARQDTAALIAREHGMDVVRRGFDERADRRDPLLDVDPRKVSAKFPAMMARIKRIMEARGNVRQALLAKSLEEVAAPRLARKFVHLWLCYTNPFMPVRGNPFADVASAHDRARIMLRGIEDICDESTGTMGSWWVK